MSLHFKHILARAEKRKGGAKALEDLLPKRVPLSTLAKVSDDRVLSCMAKRVFQAGFVWRVVDQKWPGFEEAFLGFAPQSLLFQPDEFWEDLQKDVRIIRNPQKIRSVQANAAFVAQVANKHGGFGTFLADWPADDQIGLMDYLAKQGSRLGGNSGQLFLRHIGRDAFILSGDVIACLRDDGLDITQKASSKRELRLIQEQFNTWAEATGLGYTQLSRICSMSAGENYDVATIRARSGV